MHVLTRQGASNSQSTQRVALAQRSAVLTLARVANHTETSVQSVRRELLIKIEAWRYFGLMSTPRAVA